MNGDPAEAHLLVVDDDARLRDLLRRYLVESGFRVTTAADAAEARMRLQGLAFDLLIIDVMMPGENGLALTESLRRTSPVPRIPRRRPASRASWSCAFATSCSAWRNRSSVSRSFASARAASI